MSWDVLLCRMPDCASVADIPKDFRPEPLGPRKEVIERILELFPDTDFSDPSWAHIVQPDWSITVAAGHEEICDNVMLFVHGGGDVVQAIDKLISALGCRGYDCSSGDFFRLDTAAQSFAAFQEYRDRVTGGPSIRDGEN